MWLGYLEEYPDYMTQGENMEELLENFKDIYQELISGAIPLQNYLNLFHGTVKSKNILLNI